MGCQPVQRQRWAARARAAAPRSSWSAPLASRPAKRQMIPGVQNPHWLPPVAEKARAQPSRTSASSPSRVVMARPATRLAGVTQATRGWPSTRTVQQPHWPWGLHPSFTERTPSWSRNTSSSVSRSSATRTSAPSTTISTASPRVEVTDGQARQADHPFRFAFAPELRGWRPTTHASYRNCHQYTIGNIYSLTYAVGSCRRSIIRGSRGNTSSWPQQPTMTSN